MKKTNIEIKVRISDLDDMRRKIRDLGARVLRTVNQRDTYFRISDGRLKVREIEGEREGTLIYYKRENKRAPKNSHVTLLQIQDPQALKDILDDILGTRVVVAKRRELYSLEGVQVHLDRVEDLGTFLEFELETESDVEAMSKARDTVSWLQNKLGISAEDLVRGSYSDL